ncbi:MAG: hypothetical protein ACI4GD_09155 [Lachnospiraceae bacterium]
MAISLCSLSSMFTVYIPSEEDDSVKEYLRMSDDHRDALKMINQRTKIFSEFYRFCISCLMVKRIKKVGQHPLNLEAFTNALK